MCLSIIQNILIYFYLNFNYFYLNFNWSALEMSIIMLKNSSTHVLEYTYLDRNVEFIVIEK